MLIQPRRRPILTFWPNLLQFSKCAQLPHRHTRLSILRFQPRTAIQIRYGHFLVQLELSATIHFFWLLVVITIVFPQYFQAPLFFNRGSFFVIFDIGFKISHQYFWIYRSFSLFIHIYHKSWQCLLFFHFAWVGWLLVLIRIFHFVAHHGFLRFELLSLCQIFQSEGFVFCFLFFVLVAQQVLGTDNVSLYKLWSFEHTAISHLAQSSFQLIIINSRRFQLLWFCLVPYPELFGLIQQIFAQTGHKSIFFLNSEQFLLPDGLAFLYFKELALCLLNKLIDPLDLFQLYILLI